MSLRVSTSIWFSSACSGLMYSNVPTMAPSSVNSVRSVSFGYTFEAPDDATGARGYAVRRWREDKRKGNMIEVSFTRDWRLIAVDGSSLSLGGYLITNATA